MILWKKCITFSSRRIDRSIDRSGLESGKGMLPLGNGRFIRVTLTLDDAWWRWEYCNVVEIGTRMVVRWFRPFKETLCHFYCTLLRERFPLRNLKFLFLLLFSSLLFSFYRYDSSSKFATSRRVKPPRELTTRRGRVSSELLLRAIVWMARTCKSDPDFC